MIKGVLFDFGDTLLVEERGKSLRHFTPRKTKGLDIALKSLKRRKLKMGVVANTYTSTKKEIWKVLKRVGIEKYFKMVITSVDIGSRKPKKPIFEKALKLMGLEPNEVIMIGNQIDSDILGGNRMGIITVWFHWNNRYRTKVKTEAEMPGYVISTLEDLPLIIDQIMKKKPRSIESIAKEVRKCRKCSLHKTRKHAVPGEGGKRPKIMLIGEAPGKEEDKKGRPFVGTAGRILDEVLEAAGLDRRKVFITSILKCRPPKNRNPKKNEMDECREHLLNQIASLEPKVIIALGRYGLKGLTGESPRISKVRGKVFALVNDIPIVPTYHPAAVLYNRKLKKYLVKNFEKANSMSF